MRLALQLNHDELAQLQTSIVVEMWDKRLYGRIKREWLKRFDKQERQNASRLYLMFYDWYLRHGIPQSKMLLPKTVKAIEKLVHFFGTI